jgi:hypothetical protein
MTFILSQNRRGDVIATDSGCSSRAVDTVRSNPDRRVDILRSIPKRPMSIVRSNPNRVAHIIILRRNLHHVVDTPHHNLNRVLDIHCHRLVDDGGDAGPAKDFYHACVACPERIYDSNDMIFTHNADTITIAHMLNNYFCPYRFVGRGF